MPALKKMKSRWTRHSKCAMLSILPPKHHKHLGILLTIHSHLHKQHTITIWKLPLQQFKWSDNQRTFCPIQNLGVCFAVANLPAARRRDFRSAWCCLLCWTCLFSDFDCDKKRVENQIKLVKWKIKIPTAIHIIRIKEMIFWSLNSTNFSLCSSKLLNKITTEQNNHKIELFTKGQMTVKNGTVTCHSTLKVRFSVMIGEER